MFFNLEEIKILKSAEDKFLKNIIYHQWLNTAKADFIIRFIEYIEFVFDEGHSLILGSTSDGEGLRVETENITKINDDLLAQFHGKIIIEPVDMGGNYVWLSSIGKIIKEVGLMSDDGSHFSNEAILINIDGLEFEILPAGEGIEVKTFEDREAEDEHNHI